MLVVPLEPGGIFTLLPLVFTWLNGDGFVSSRIDFVGCPFAWVASVSSCDIVPCPFSDHCAVLFCVSVPVVVPPGPGVWKLNVSVLEEGGDNCLIKNFLAGWRHQKSFFPSVAKWWEAGKSRISSIVASALAPRLPRGSFLVIWRCI